MDKSEIFRIYANVVVGQEGWSKGKLADSLGVGPQHLSGVLNRKNSVTDTLYAKMDAIAKKVLPPEFFQERTVDVTDKLTPRARAILKMIAEIEGGSEEDALNQAIEQFGPIYLQSNAQKPLQEKAQFGE